jgi:hypothetical protein
MPRIDVVSAMTVVRLGVCMTAVLLAACPKKTAIWVVPGSTPANLQFGLGRSRGNEKAGQVGYLVVQQCGNYGDTTLAAWGLAPRGGGSGPGLPGRVTYGVVPEGFEEPARPQALASGRYIAFTDGSGAVHFEIEESGAVRELAHCASTGEVKT